MSDTIVNAVSSGSSEASSNGALNGRYNFSESFDSEASLTAMAAQVVEAAEALTVARADAERVIAAEALALETSAVQEAASMSGNVRKCPVLERRRLPKPPQSPEDPTESDWIVATRQAANDTAANPLSPAQRIAIAALVAGQTAVVAARRAGVTPRTIHRWQQDPLFSETLDRLTDETLDAATRRVRNLLLRSTHVISDALQGSDQYRWAMRVVGSSQVWKAGKREPREASA